MELDRALGAKEFWVPEEAQGPPADTAAALYGIGANGYSGLRPDAVHFPPEQQDPGSGEVCALAFAAL